MYKNSLYLRDRRKRTFISNNTLRISTDMNIRIFEADAKTILISTKNYTP
jgi:hypothetical protein